MSRDVQSEESKALDQVEHNSDASAKRVSIRYQNPEDGEWYNFIPSKTPNVDYDYIGVVNSDPTSDTLTFKRGGSSGTTVQTITVTYASSSVDKVSDNLDNVAFS